MVHRRVLLALSAALTQRTSVLRSLFFTPTAEWSNWERPLPKSTTGSVSTWTWIGWFRALGGPAAWNAKFGGLVPQSIRIIPKAIRNWRLCYCHRARLDPLNFQKKKLTIFVKVHPFCSKFAQFIRIQGGFNKFCTFFLITKILLPNGAPEFFCLQGTTDFGIS